jgi:ABC-type antimicrobial peptide transport system permease subunit
MLVVRAMWARRWRSLCWLAVLFGVGAAVVLVAFAGARRTHSSLQRFVTESRAVDGFLLVDGFDDTTVEALRRLPPVEAATTITTYLATSSRTSFDIGLLAPEDERLGRDFERPRLVAGRLPDPNAPDEVFLNDVAREQIDAHVGDTLDLTTFTPAQMDALRAGTVTEPPVPGGPALHLRVVGIGRVPIDLSGQVEASYITTPAFARTYGADVARSPDATLMAFRLRTGATVEELQAGVDATLPPGERRIVIDSAEDLRPAVRTVGSLTTGLQVFGGVAAVAALVVIGQAISRQTRAHADDLAPLRAIGFTRRDRVSVLLLIAAPVAVSSAVVAVVVAVLASPLMPIGLARLAEPSPGVDVDAVVLGAGALALVVIIGVFVVAAAWARPAVREARPSSVARLTRNLGPSASTGAALALDRRPPALPVRSALAAVSVSVIGAVAAVTVASTLHRLIEDPHRWGYSWDLLVDANPSDPAGTLDTVSADPDVAAAALWSSSYTYVDGVGSKAFGLEPAKGSLSFDVLQGRGPATADELVLGPHLADELGKHVGDEVALTYSDATSARTARVVGIALFPDGTEGNFANAVGYTDAGFAAHKVPSTDPADEPQRSVAVKVASGRSVPSVAARLGDLRPGQVSAYSYPSRPPDVANLDGLRNLPALLAAFVAVLGLGALTHVLATTIRRRRAHLATLRAIGFTPRQLRGAIRAQSVCLVAAATVIGVLGGLVVARVAWRFVAEPIGIATDVDAKPVVLALVVVANALGALLVAAPFGFLAQRRAQHPARRE